MFITAFGRADSGEWSYLTRLIVRMALHRDFAPRIPYHPPVQAVVGIIGHPGIGKTHFATHLARAVCAAGTGLPLVALDGFLRPAAERDAAGVAGCGPEGVRAAQVFWMLRAFLYCGKVARFPVHHHATRRRDSTVVVSPAPVVFVEGTALCRPELRAMTNLLVFLDATEPVRRVLHESAYVSRGRSVADACATYERESRAYEQFIAPLAAEAHVVLNVGTDRRVRVVRPLDADGRIRGKCVFG